MRNRRLRILGLILTISGVTTWQPARAGSRPSDGGTTAAATKQTEPAVAPPSPGLHFERTTLANGLSALLLRDPAAPMTGVFAVVRAGQIHEGAGEDGLSHFLEHLLFNGTTEYTQEALYAAVDRMGGYSNATTRADHTVFQMLIPRAHLGTALKLHHAMLFRSTLPAEKFDKERGIVLEEIARDSAAAEQAVEDAFRAYQWSGTPLARPILGTAETLRSISREAVLAYWKRRYTTGNTTILVVGDVEPAALRGLLEQAYGAEPPSAIPAAMEQIARTPAGQELRTMPAELEQVELRLAFAGPDPGHPDAWSLDVLGALLSAGPGPSLENELRARGIAGASGSAALDRVAGTSSFRLAIQAPAGTDPRKLLTATIEACAGAAARASDDDLRSVRVRLASAAALLAEKPHYFGLEKSGLLTNSGAGAVEGEALAQEQVGLTPLRDASLRWLTGRPFRALVAGRGLSAETSAIQGAGTGDSGRTAGTAGAASRERVTRTLANGLRLSVTSNPATRVLAIHVLFANRGDAENGTAVAQAGYGELLQRLLVRRGEPFERELAAMGSSLKTFDDPGLPFDDYYDVPEYGYLRMEVTTAHAAAAVRALRGLLSPPTFTAADFESARNEQLALLAREQSSASVRSARALATSLYGADSPLAHSPRGDAATIKEATPASLLGFASRWLDPRRLIVTVETGLDATMTADLLGSELGKLTANRSTTATRAQAMEPPGTGNANAPCATVEETLGGKQSYLRLGRSTQVPAADRAAFTLAAAVLSERLAADIREQRGQAYSIGAGVVFRGSELADAWTASAGTRPENAAAVATRMREITAQLAQDGPSQDELALAAARLGGRELMRRLTGIGRAYYAGVDINRGDAPGSSLELVESLPEVTVESVRTALSRWFSPESACAVSVK